MTARRSRFFSWLVIAATASLSLGFEACFPEDFGSPWFHFRSPIPLQLSEIGPLEYELRTPNLGHLRGLTLSLEREGDVAQPVSIGASQRGSVSGSFEVAEPGRYRLRAEAELELFFFLRHRLAAATAFEAVELEASDECEVLNGINCMIPYPSSHFFRKDPSSSTGLRLDVSASVLARAMPTVQGEPLDPTPYLELDGSSPTAQILMHFPGGVDLEASGAPRLLPPGPVPVSAPWVDTRTVDGRSLEPDSPTLLIRARTGEQVLHFVELDARAAGNSERRLLIMRPGESLIPGERYIVAVRGLVHPGGEPIEPEPPFAALRDWRATTIEGLAARRHYFERRIFKRLRRLGVERSDLILAFDFTVQSDEALTSEMLSMRDQSFTWLEDQLALGQPTFSVDDVDLRDCSDPDETTWKVVRGRFEVPLFLSADPELDSLSVGRLTRDADGEPLPAGVTEPPYTISLPCTVLDPSAPPANPLVLGHGLFGKGEDMVDGFAAGFGLDYIAGATNWRGLSGQKDPQNRDDFRYLLFKVIGLPVPLGTGSRLNDLPSLPDRLRQGQLNTLLLARMMKLGAFNLSPEFRTPDDRGAFPGGQVEMFYYGISLGGIMGTMFSALTPDVERLHLDVPAINFGYLLQRSTQFGAFEIPLNAIGLSDPAEQLLGIGLIHELWVRAEPAGYARHITGLVDPPLPGTNAKRILMTVAWLDKQVSNQAQEVMVRTLGIPNLVGSVQERLQGIADAPGPLDSAVVIWDAGSFDIFDPAYDAVIPPLRNVIPSDKCDPHARRLRIPAAILQTEAFLRPDGQIENFCNGACDADGPFERPDGTEAVCDPLAG